jgi:UDP-N-acetylmuramoyl-tripeptide--D-alanyl-D-alanine ligase
MTTQWKSQDVMAATGEKTTGNWCASSVSIDTRSLQPGALFVALTAERDGHEYVAQALSNGAVAALVNHAVDGVSLEQQIIVTDTNLALQQLGAAARARSAAKFIGITGSVGKTGSKEMLAAALAPLGNVYATYGNLNNHLGVPLTLANMPLETQFAVIEMGMNHAGEIAPLSNMARPHVALITTVDAVHLEHFANVEAIADEKAAIFAGMQDGGVAVLNHDNPHFTRLKNHAEAVMDRVLSFGSNAESLCRMTGYRIENNHSVVEASIAGTALTYALGTIGKHWAIASVAVLGVVDALRGDLAKASAALQHFEEPAGRGKIRDLAVKGGHLRLVDDAYNASPISMKGAIEKIAEIRNTSQERFRTVIVLGDMLELGEGAEDLHVGLMPAIINNQMDLVFAAGKFMQKLYDALPETMRGAYRATSRELAPVVVQSLRHRDIVLVKGSHGSRMELVVEAMEENARAIEVHQENYDAV